MSQQQLLLGVGAKGDIPAWVMETGDVVPSGTGYNQPGSKDGRIAANNEIVAWCSNKDYLSGKVVTEYNASGNASLASSWQVGTVTCADHNGNIKWAKELMYDEQLPTRTNKQDQGAFVCPMSLDIDSSNNVYVLACLDLPHLNRLELGLPQVIMKFNSSGSLVAKKLIGQVGAYPYMTGHQSSEHKKFGGQICCMANGKLFVVCSSQAASNKLWPLDMMVLDNDLTPGGDRKQFGPYVNTGTWVYSYSEYSIWPMFLQSAGNSFSFMHHIAANHYSSSWMHNGVITGSINSSGQISFHRLYAGGNNPTCCGVVQRSDQSYSYLLRSYDQWDQAGPSNLRYSVGLIKKQHNNNQPYNNGSAYGGNETSTYQKVFFWTTGSNTSNTGNTSDKSLVAGGYEPGRKQKMLLDETNGHIYVLLNCRRNRQETSGTCGAVAKFSESTGVLIWSRSIVSSEHHRDGTIPSREANYFDMAQSDDSIFVYYYGTENTDDEGWHNGDNWNGGVYKWRRTRICILKIPKDGAGAVSYTTTGVNSSDEYDNWSFQNDAVPLQTHATQSAWNDGFSMQQSINNSYSWNSWTDGNWEDRVGTNYNDMFFTSYSPWQVSDVTAQDSTKSVNVIAVT